MTKIFLDLDGVLADFDANFQATFGIPNKGMADDDMWARINSHPTFWSDMPVMPGAVSFLSRTSVFDPIILTACPKSDYANAARRKRDWVRQNLSSNIMVLPVMGGSNKPLFMHRPGDILIDDFKRNVNAWNASGGIGILHTSFPDTWQQLHWHLGVWG